QIAARLAAKRPDLVRAVVSIDGALGFGSAAGASSRRRPASSPPATPIRWFPGCSPVSTLPPPTRPSNAGTRAGCKACRSTSCASPSVRSSPARSDRGGGGKRPILPAADGSLLSSVQGLRAGQSHAAVVLALQVKGGGVDRSGAL